eukprot:3834542-Rhodomonas_salina.3
MPNHSGTDQLLPLHITLLLQWRTTLVLTGYYKAGTDAVYGGTRGSTDEDDMAKKVLSFLVGAMVLRAPYAMSGTERAYQVLSFLVGALTSTLSKYRNNTNNSTRCAYAVLRAYARAMEWPRVLLRTRYAMSGTDKVYGATATRHPTQQALARSQVLEHRSVLPDVRY